jgi:hypothetical protein
MCKQARIVMAAARTAFAAGTVMVAALALVGIARAGEYHVYSCRTPGGQPAPTDGWGEVGHSINDFTADTCAEAGGLVAGLKDGYLHSADSETDKATWAFEAPADETIAAATLWRAGDTAGGSNTKASYLFWLSGVAATGLSSQIFDECAASSGCLTEGNLASPLAAENRVAVPASALDSRYLSVDTYCGAKLVSEAKCPEGKDDPSGYAATIELFAADLTLSDSESPVVSAVGGGLAEAPTVSGRSDVAFEATDAGAGVYQVVFRVDGEVVSTVVPEEDGGRCRNVGGTTDGLPAFLYTQPCPAALSVDLPFDTTGLTNGVHHVVVSVLDAAGNSTPVLDRQITVANAAAPSGGPGGGDSNGSGSTGSSSGSGASGEGSAGSSSVGSGATLTAGASASALGPANGTDASDQAILTAVWKGHAGERLSGSYGAARTVEGRLSGPGGTAIAAAQIEVGELPAVAGAHPRVLPSPRTGAAGRWSLKLPRGISSGELRFAYRSHLGEPTPVATRTLALSVRAGVALSVAPRLARADGRIRFDGRLLGGPVPAGGKQLVLEARSPGGRWIEFHVVRAEGGDGGRFHFVYRFRLPGPTRYQFRVLSEAEADYPFAAGGSNVVRVYER